MFGKERAISLLATLTFPPHFTSLPAPLRRGEGRPILAPLRVGGGGGGQKGDVALKSFQLVYSQPNIWRGYLPKFD